MSWHCLIQPFDPENAWWYIVHLQNLASKNQENNFWICKCNYMYLRLQTIKKAIYVFPIHMIHVHVTIWLRRIKRTISEFQKVTTVDLCPITPQWPTMALEIQITRFMRLVTFHCEISFTDRRYFNYFPPICNNTKGILKVYYGLKSSRDVTSDENFWILPLIRLRQT